MLLLLFIRLPPRDGAHFLWRAFQYVSSYPGLAADRVSTHVHKEPGAE